MVEKGGNGWLEIARHDSTAMPLGWGVALLGSAITALAAPWGSPSLRRSWRRTPNGKAQPQWSVASGTKFPETGSGMGNLLEARQTGLVLVAVDHSVEHINSVFCNATTKIVTDCVQADLEADFTTAIEKATRFITHVFTHSGGCRQRNTAVMNPLGHALRSEPTSAQPSGAASVSAREHRSCE